MLSKTAKASAIERYVTESPSVVMREVAKVAAARGLSVPQLALAYSKAARSCSIKAANVVRHFKAERPQKGTVDLYARALGIVPEHIELVSGKPLSHSRMQSWLLTIKKEISGILNAEDVASKVYAALTGLPDLAIVVAQYALATHRTRTISLSAASPLQIVRERLAGIVEIPTARCFEPKDEFLGRIFCAARDAGLRKNSMMTLIDVARTFASDEGLDVISMDKQLTKTMSPTERSYFQQRQYLTSYPEAERDGP